MRPPPPPGSSRRPRHRKFLVPVIAALAVMGVIALVRFSPNREIPSNAIEDGYENIDFDLLAGFPVEVDTDGRWQGVIPDAVKRLDSHPVDVRGFMLALEFVTGTDRIKKFLLLRDQASCCFGFVPAPNAVIVVTAASADGADYITDVPINVQGTLAVGDNYVDGKLEGLYRMSADQVLIPEKYQNMSSRIRTLQNRLLKGAQ